LADIVGEIVAVEVGGVCPRDGPGFFGELKVIGGSSEMEEDVVVKVVGLTFGGGDAVDVEAGERRDGIGYEVGAGFFDDFAAGGVPDFAVFGLDVASGEEPAIESTVVDQEEALAVGSEDEAGARDMAGMELIAGEGIGSGSEEHEDELARFRVGDVGGAADELGDGGREHELENEKAPGWDRGL
jgi:hypothetical protein